MKRYFNLLKSEPFDILVIGGGIYGAWTSYLSSKRGLRVAIVERNDWACGASSASTKLIHGGLRYLEQLHFGLVKKALEERRLLTEQAPHMVLPIKFLVPMYHGSRVGPFRMNLGLTLYSKLAGGNNELQTYDYLSKEELITQFPFIKSDNITSAFSYNDAQTDDARFTLEVIKSSVNNGTVAVNYTEAVDLLEEDGRINGAILRDLETGEELCVHASVVVNTAGYRLNELTGKYNGPSLTRFTRGVHLILPSLSTKEAFLIFARKDGRVMFILPWYGKTLIGTTDTDYTGDLESIPVRDQDVSYLLEEANNVLKDVNWQPGDILGSFAGLRVLQNLKGSSPSSISREWTVKKIQDGLLVSIGGKFTTSRQDAEIIVDKALSIYKPKLKKTVFNSKTVGFTDAPEGKLSLWRSDSLKQGLSLGVDRETVKFLQFRYGKAISQIYSIIGTKKTFNRRIDKTLPFCRAEIVYAIQEEMAVHLEDIVRRRIPLVLLNKISEKSIIETADLSAKILDWNRKKKISETDKVLGRWSNYIKI
jgi:glycerol-3-phosphate dehydrogenase